MLIENSRASNVNHILAALPAEEYERLAPHLEPFEMKRGLTIYHSHGAIPYLYFPTNSMISVVAVLSDGSMVEAGVVGREGVGGVPALLGADSTPHESMVQLPGDGVRIKTKILREEFKRGGALHDSVLRYTNALLAQVGQTAACNRLHTIEERLARWLLMTHDRAAGDELPLTQEFLAMMLGTRRAGVTGAAIALQGENLIRYHRGNITILDRAGLEDFSCECYSLVKPEFDRIMSS